MSERLNPKDFQPNSLTTKYDLSGFKCEKVAYARYLKKEAFRDHNTSIGRVFLMVDKKRKKVAGYVTLAMGNLPKEGNDDDKFNSLGTYNTIPGLLLGQLARDIRYKGMGRILLDFVIIHALELSEKVGCRILYVHSDPDKVEWYQDNGFKLVKGSERTLFMDLIMDEPERS